MSETRIPTSIYRLAQRISAIHAEVQKMGIFIGDRELMSCSSCGLMEDVDADGILLTCCPDILGVDTGLRFEEVNSDGLCFRCPACGIELASPENAVKCQPHEAIAHSRLALENRSEDGDMECETVPEATRKEYLQVRQEDTERKKLTKSKSGKRKGGK